MAFLAYKLLVPASKPEEGPVVPAEKPREIARLRLVSPEELAALAAPPPPPQIATPPPTPPPKKDRISIGPPSDRRAEKIILERDREISNKAQGDGAVGPGEKRLPSTPPPMAAPPPVPNGPLTEPSRSIMGSLRQFDKKLEQGGSGLGFEKRGPMHADIAYDPQGADFTDWIEHWRREVYRNWVAPQAALMGFKGKVLVRFVVDRNGKLIAGEIVEGSGTVSLDRAAKNAILGSLMRPLPSDYGPDTFEMLVTFIYS